MNQIVRDLKKIPAHRSMLFIGYQIYKFSSSGKYSIRNMICQQLELWIFPGGLGGNGSGVYLKI